MKEYLFVRYLKVVLSMSSNMKVTYEKRSAPFRKLSFCKVGKVLLRFILFYFFASFSTRVSNATRRQPELVPFSIL